jgi:hypothetical protein
MAIAGGTGKGSDFKIYDEYFRGRFNELIATNSSVFNAASNGAIRLTSKSERGNYAYESFFQNLTSSMVSRRDLAVVSAQTDTPLIQEELISVKLNRKMVPVAQTRDAFRKIFGNFSATEFSGLVAEQMANAAQLEMLNSALNGGIAALRGQSASYHFYNSLGVMDTTTLVDALAKMGDRADRIVCFVMHSKPYYDLVKQQIGLNITGVSNFAVAQATPVTLNRPVIVTDASGMRPLVSPDIGYYTLALTKDALQVENSEEQDVVLQDVSGLEQLVVRIQGEYAYNLGVKGFKWDVSNGGANPTNATLMTGSNWDVAYGDVKDRAGVAIMTN